MIRFKHRPRDFKVREVSDLSRVGTRGEYSIFKVTKVKRSTLDVVALLASRAGVSRSEVAFAGLKDRQGRTTQVFSIRTTRKIKLDERDLEVRWLGRSAEPVSAEWNRANHFEIVVRGLGARDLQRFERSVREIRAGGLPNYFDDQRFGCLRHGQGFIIKLLLRGRYGDALRKLVAAPSRFDGEDEGYAKALLRKRWGDWEACWRISKGRRRHHSVFRHLMEHPEDYRGAFRHIAHRERLIHLYAYQSYLWNRTAARWVRTCFDGRSLLQVGTDMGVLPVWRASESVGMERLGGIGIPLIDARSRPADSQVARALRAVLEEEKLRQKVLDRLDIAGLVFKHQERPLLLVPGGLSYGEPEPDESEERASKVKIEFELPRGSYATMVLKRLFLAGRRPLGEEPAERGRRGEKTMVARWGRGRPSPSSSRRKPRGAQ